MLKYRIARRNTTNSCSAEKIKYTYMELHTFNILVADGRSSELFGHYGRNYKGSFWRF
jgi:hypothetical protein